MDVGADGVLPVLRTQPELVCRDRANLADLHERAQRAGERMHRLDRRDGVPARHDVLRLDLIAGARGEAHAEVRQAVRPRSRHAQLPCGVDRVHAEDRMTLCRGGARAEQIGGDLLGRVRDTALHPHLIRGLAPAGTDADAVAAGGDLVEVLEQGVPGEALEHALSHLVGGLDVERDPRDRAQRAKRDHQAVEAAVAPARGEDLAV
jgi:hypothetical protein